LPKRGILLDNRKPELELDPQQHEGMLNSERPIALSVYKERQGARFYFKV
jgi:hypothetical protein